MLAHKSDTVFARRTLDDWWYAYQYCGFAALRPQTRADKGQVRTLSPQQQKWILEQAQAHLGVPVKVLYRRWREEDPQLASLQHGLSLSARARPEHQDPPSASQTAPGRGHQVFRSPLCQRSVDDRLLSLI